jgi:hypothetical protein
VESYAAFINLYRYIHKIGVNSLKRFVQYDVKSRDTYLDGGYVLGAFSPKLEMAKSELQRVSEEPCSECYKMYMKEMEYFRTEKKTIRLQRAEGFMKQFLEINEITYEDLDHEDYFTKKLELIHEFRENTDLSFRDIGAVLDLSHTSVIRLWKKAHEHMLASSAH